jgi:hypothetical protein
MASGESKLHTQRLLTVFVLPSVSDILGSVDVRNSGRRSRDQVQVGFLSIRIVAASR